MRKLGQNLNVVVKLLISAGMSGFVGYKICREVIEIVVVVAKVA